MNVGFIIVDWTSKLGYSLMNGEAFHQEVYVSPERIHSSANAALDLLRSREADYEMLDEYKDIYFIVKVNILDFFRSGNRKVDPVHIESAINGRNRKILQWDNLLASRLVYEYDSRWSVWK